MKKLSEVLTTGGVFNMLNAIVTVTKDDNLVTIELRSVDGKSKEVLKIPAGVFTGVRAPIPQFSHWMMEIVSGEPYEHVVVMLVDAAGVLVAPGKGGRPYNRITALEFLGRSRLATADEIGEELEPAFLPFPGKAGRDCLVFGYQKGGGAGGKFFLPRVISHLYETATRHTPIEDIPLSRGGNYRLLKEKAGSLEVEGYWMSRKEDLVAIPMQQLHTSTSEETTKMLLEAIKPEWVDITVLTNNPKSTKTILR